MQTLSFLARRAAGAAGLLVIAATAAAAQKPAADIRWEPWIGCWQPTAQFESPGPLGGFVCVRPTAVSTAVELVTVDSGKIVARDTIDAGGTRRTMSAQGCEGWRTAEWSQDSRRVYLKSELKCGTGFARTSTGVLAMSSNAEWLDIQSANVSGNSALRSVRYLEMGSWMVPDLPAEFADLVSSGAQPSQARMIASTPLTVNDIIDASRHLDTVVVQALLVERNQRFEVDAHALSTLASAGVPGSVTDVLVGLAYPDYFAVRTQPGAQGTATVSGSRTNTVRDARYDACTSAWDPMGYSPYDYNPCGYRYGYGSYRPYYGYGSYGYYGPVFGGGYSPPVVVVKPELAHGKAVNGQGYTRGRSSGSSGQSTSEAAAPPASSRSSESSRSSGSASGRSSGGSSSSGSSSGSSTGRTAQARPPGKGQ